MSRRSNNIWFQFNRRVIEWTRETFDEQSKALQRAIKKGTDRTVSSLQYVNSRDTGMVNYAGFRFEKTAIYIEKGVGGVYKVDPKGSGIVVRKTPGPINRQKAPWLAPVMEKRLALLTELVSEEWAKVVGQTTAETLENTVKLKGIR